MSRQFHGITTETLRRFLVDAGAVYINFGTESERLLGATRDGNRFVVEQDVRTPPVDGSPGPLVGTRRVVEVRPQLTANLLEMSYANLKIALAGSDGEYWPDEYDPTHHSIKRTRPISINDYIDNVALVGRVSGTETEAVFIIKNALGDSNLEVVTNDKDETVIALTFTGHFDVEDMDEEPWEILWPIEEA